MARRYPATNNKQARHASENKAVATPHTGKPEAGTSGDKPKTGKAATEKPSE